MGQDAVYVALTVNFRIQWLRLALDPASLRFSLQSSRTGISTFLANTIPFRIRIVHFPASFSSGPAGAPSLENNGVPEVPPTKVYALYYFLPGGR
jgi:hypothetical protein